MALCSTIAQATLTLTPITSPSFGILLAGASGRQFVLGTNSTISGTNASDYISGATAGSMTVADDTAQVALKIEALNITPIGGLSVARILCSYNGGLETRCDNGGYQVNSGASVTLLLGLDISTTQVHSGSDSASVSFDIEITYI
jgi:hypothetical protein